MKLVLTCEHAGNEIPLSHRQVFKGAGSVLASHRGYDPGALSLFQALKNFSWFSRFQMTSRLLVEVNRSLHHPHLFSEYTKDLPERTRKQILKDYYFPYRTEVENKIADKIQSGEVVLHLSVHTFTPELNGEIRTTDIGFLYDPQRREEKEISRILKNFLKMENSHLTIRNNYPYLGTADGFTTYLRRRFPDRYMGIEVEVNQKFVQDNKMEPTIKSNFQNIIGRLFSEGGSRKE